MTMAPVLDSEHPVDVLALSITTHEPGAQPVASAPVETLWLRLGLAFVFLYAAVSGTLDPASFAAYFPSFLPNWAVDIALPLFALYEVALAVAFLTGTRTHAASLLATATLIGIIIFNPDAFSVLFRNVAIAGAALTLASATRSPARAERAPATSG